MILSLCLWFRYFIHVNSVEASAFLLPRGWKTVFEAFFLIIDFSLHLAVSLESRFEALFQFRPWPKCCFRRFSFFGHGRNAFFFIFKLSAAAETLLLLFFYSSAAAESRFSPFFHFQPWRKRCFCCFLFIRRGGKPIFSVFPVSAVAETLFLLFSIHPPRRKADFRRFLSVVPLRKTVFAVFYWLYPYETRFFAFSARRTPTKGGFCRFLLIVPLRNAVFSVFCSS